MNTGNNGEGKFYYNPYFGGVVLGLILLATFYITGRGLGASGAAKSTVVAAVDRFAPQHAHKSAYYSKFLSDDDHPLNNWLVFEVIGVLAGAFLSGAIWGRLKFTTEHNPKIPVRRRLIFAGIGGLFFGFGSQLARGCTSGAALSGAAVLSLGGFITMMAIFGSAYAFAYFFRKIWI